MRAVGDGRECPARSVMGLMIAGDGYAYVPYETVSAGCSPQCEFNHYGVQRVSSTGAATDITILDWSSFIFEGLPVGAAMITNADAGILLSGYAIDYGFFMANVTGSSVSLTTPPSIPGQGSVLVPVLQAQDGSFIGTVDNDQGSSMVAFDASGNVRWSVPNEMPLLATADGGVLAASGTTYDSNGLVTAQGPVYTQSWTYNVYQSGPALLQLEVMPTLLATSWAFQAQIAAAKPLPDSVKAGSDQVIALGTIGAHRDIVYYPFQGQTYLGPSSRTPVTITITEYLIKVTGDWPPGGCNAADYNPNANETFCSFDDKEFDDRITYAFVRRQQLFVQVPGVRKYRVQIYPCTAQNRFGGPVHENQLSAPTQAAIAVNGDSGSTAMRMCAQ
jgi:hypothetical protein